MWVTSASPLTPWTYMVHLFPTQSNTTKISAWSQCFEFGKGSLAHELNIFRVQVFISGVALLPAGLNSTPMESHRNTHISLLPTSLVSTLVELHASPQCAGILSCLSPLYFSRGLCIGTYLFLGRKRDPDLLRSEEVVPSEKHVIHLTNVFSFRFSPSLFLLVGWA